MTLREEDGLVLALEANIEAKDFAFKMLGNVLVTKQTGDAGRTVKRVYIESGSNIARELYLSIVIDRTCGLPLIMASTEGGMGGFAFGLPLVTVSHSLNGSSEMRADTRAAIGTRSCGSG